MASCWWPSFVGDVGTPRTWDSTREKNHKLQGVKSGECGGVLRCKDWLIVYITFLMSGSPFEWHIVLNTINNTHF